MKEAKNIVIIENDALLGVDIKRELEKTNFSVERKSSIKHAEELLLNDKTDLIIANTDVTDDPLFHKIKIYLKKLQTPFVWISSHTKHEMTSTIKNCSNAVGTFFKPFNSKDLVHFIVNFFKGKKS